MAISGSALKLDYPVLMENPLQTIPTADGLSDNAVDDMVMDKEGVIWLGSEGFYCLKRICPGYNNRVTPPLN